MCSWRGKWLMLVALAVPSAIQGQNECSLLKPKDCPGASALIASGLSKFAAEHATTLVQRAVKAVTNDSTRDFHVALKYFSSADGDDSGPGFEYNYENSLRRWVRNAGGPNVTASELSLEAIGNIAFNRSANPRDFLKTKAALDFMRSTGGVAKALTPETQQRLTEIALELATVPTAELPNHPKHQEALEAITRSLGLQLFVMLSGEAAFETNQAFERQQVAFGGRLGVDVKDWSSRTLFSRLNVLDWPFALTRWITATENTFRPRGSALPSLMLGLDQVHPQDDTTRAGLNELDPYPRFSAEAGYRTLVARVMDTNIFAEGNLRLYQEFGASEAIKAADLDRFFHWVFAVTGPEGLFVSYSKGRLPFDRLDDQVYEVGFRYKF